MDTVGRLSIAARKTAGIETCPTDTVGRLPIAATDRSQRRMPNFRRYYIPNAIVFITGVTRDRVPYLEPEDNIELFWETMRHVQEVHPFHLLAYVILPDHFHWLMRVDDESGDFSVVLHSVKRNFTLNFKKAHGIAAPVSLWQKRFWDHVIRGEEDLNNHFDYIHWNPVKHGYVRRPEDWSHSMYLYWLECGYYQPGWGHEGEPSDILDMDLE
jgi:putative transposase